MNNEPQIPSEQRKVIYVLIAGLIAAAVLVGLLIQSLPNYQIVH